MTVANSARPPTLYRALQFTAFLAPLPATVLTIYALAGHGVPRGHEGNPFMATLFAHGWPGGVLGALVRLAVSLSVFAQSAYLWRHGQRDRSLLILGWAILVAWTLLTTLDALNDAWVLLH